KNGRSNHQELFVWEAAKLKALECHIIYTVPMSLAYEQNLGSEYAITYLLPMVALEHKGAIDAMKEVLNKRIDLPTVFQNPASASKILIEGSGGCLRDLMRLVQIAMTGQDSPISNERAEGALRELGKEYSRLITEEDRELLLSVYHQQTCDGSGRA